MPNHVDNCLRIYGNVETIHKVFERYGSEGKALDAGKVIPYPEVYQKADEYHEEMMEKARRKEIPWEEVHKVKDGYNNGGYEWCLEHWGTKWGMYDFDTPVEYKRSIKVGFHSAWAPPLPVILQMSRDFPELTFYLRYWERGLGFQGKYKCKAGEVLLDEETNYRGSKGG